MSNTFIGVLLAIGFGGWVYAKTSRSTGGNTQTAVIVASIAAFFAFVVCLTVLSYIPDGK